MTHEELINTHKLLSLEYQNDIIGAHNNAPITIVLQDLWNKIQENQKLVLVDPPEGHTYGFPKHVERHITKNTNKLNTWLVANGYPQKLIDDYKDSFFVRIIK